MANMIYVSITGKNQGLISAGCSTFDSIGNRYQTGHEDQIMVHSFEHTISRDLKVNHGPISFIKPLDKSSPLIGVAISNDEELDIKIDVYRTSTPGSNQLYYTVKLAKAYISRVSVICPHSIDHTTNQPEEMVSIKYRSITWEHHTAGTSGYSIWEERVY